MDLDDRSKGSRKAAGRYLWVVLVVIGIGVFVCANMLWDSLFGTSINGSIIAEGSEVGSWVFAPDICESGFRRSFYGVRMFSSHDSHLAFVYVEDPTQGRSIEVKVPDKDEGYRFFEKDCGTFEASVQTGALINSVRSIGGTINLSCEAQGGRVRGSLRFENCH
ncbi:hypothetical protein [Bradyrhizobium sp.]|uniref:hypothetical protein n=1 Tax=Bradyrhizobium sp. TaxID=376 RepID=UPI003C5750B8